MKHVFRFVLAGAIVAVLIPSAQGQAQNSSRESVVIDVAAPAQPFPHFWEQMFGSGRAILRCARAIATIFGAVKEITGFEYVRFHAIFHDEVGVYEEDEPGIRIQLLLRGPDLRRPAGEWRAPVRRISFMPKKLAAQRCAPRLLVQAQCLAAQRLYELGRPDPHFSKTWSTAMASTRSRSGTSKSGMSRTSTSGLATRSSPPTGSSTTTPPARSRA